MNTRQRFGLAGLLLAASAAVGLLAAPDLPARMATHWNAAGVPDGTMSRAVALALVPAIGFGLLALFAVLPRLDPLGENIAAFRPHYDGFVLVLSAFLAVLHVGVVAFNLGYEFDFTLFVLAAVAALFYYVGVLLDNVERNWFIGVRTPWTLSDDRVWDRTHALAARLFKLSALVAAVGLLFGDAAIYFLLVPALGTAVVTVVYSYYLYERLPDPDTEPAPR